MLRLLYLAGAIGVTLAATTLRIQVSDGQVTTNTDTLAPLRSSVVFTCSDNTNANTGSISLVGHVVTELASAAVGTWTISSMSVEDQGTYRCDVESQSVEVAVITVPPDTTVQVVSAKGEKPTLSCPLGIVETLSHLYMVEWRVPVDRTVARSGSGELVPWARLNNESLELTVGPLNSTLPRMFECVVLSFSRGQNSPSLRFGNVPKGTVNITILSAQMLQVTVSPRVIASGSSVQFNVSCRAKNITQNLYNAEYRFFHCGTEVPASAASNSSYTLVNATTTGNFTCTATQHSDMGTAITSELSSPVQAIVLDKPLFSGRRALQNSDCMQEVTLPLQQPVPDEMYYTFSSVQTDSCVGLRGMRAVNITTNSEVVKFTVNVGDSGLDTRQQIYLISWYVMDSTMGPCSSFQLQSTDLACPPEHTIFTPLAIAVIVVAGVVVVILLTVAATVGVAVAIWRHGKNRGVVNFKPRFTKDENVTLNE